MTINGNEEYQHLSSGAQEAANRGEAIAILIRAGYRVGRPEFDIDGEDLWIRQPNGNFLPVQLKGRATVDRTRYGGKGLWMLFPNRQPFPGRSWYLVPHDDLASWIEDRHGHTEHWKDNQSWSYSRVSSDLEDYLEQFRIQSPHPTRVPSPRRGKGGFSADLSKYLDDDEDDVPDDEAPVV